MSRIYCIKENKKTKDIDPTYVRSKNNRLMLKAKCGSCGIIKTQFVKENKEGKFGIHKAMLPLLPKKGLTLPGHRYCGPGNPLDNGPPTNRPSAGYRPLPPRGNFVHYDFLKLQYISHKMRHVSPLKVEALSCNSNITYVTL